MYKYLVRVKVPSYTCLCPFLRSLFCKDFLYHISASSMKNKTVSLRVSKVGDVSISQAW